MILTMKKINPPYLISEGKINELKYSSMAAIERADARTEGRSFIRIGLIATFVAVMFIGFFIATPRSESEIIFDTYVAQLQEQPEEIIEEMAEGIVYYPNDVNE